MHVVINTGAISGDQVSISDEAAKAVRMSFNPSTLPQVDKLKALGAAFLSLCDEVGDNRETSIAKDQAETAVMWAVKAATAGA
jgi:hypothetical protein